MKNKDYKVQFVSEIEHRIKELECMLRQARKQKVDESMPAVDFGGDFSYLDEDIRICDIEEYVEWLSRTLKEYKEKKTQYICRNGVVMERWNKFANDYIIVSVPKNLKGYMGSWITLLDIDNGYHKGGAHGSDFDIIGIRN